MKKYSHMRKIETQVDFRGYATIILLLLITYLTSYYLHSTDFLSYEQYRLITLAIVAIAFIYIVTLVIRNRDIMKLRPSRHTRMHKGEELESYIHQMHSEGKSLEEITIVSGLSIDEAQKILETNEK